MIGVGYLFATAIGFVQIAPRSTTDELSKAFVDSMGQGLLVTDTKGRVDLRQPRLWRDDRCNLGGRHQDGREPAVGRARGLVDHLPARLRPDATARRATASSGCRRPSGPAPNPARAGTGRGRAPSTCPASASRCWPGSSPTSPRSAPSRSASFSTCRRRSIISTMRRPASSRPTRKAASPISTRRLPSGWASTWPVSRRAR